MERRAIADLLQDGFAVLPVVRGDKRPAHDGWLKRTFTAEDFHANHNVGVKCGAPSGHKVDVDLDAPEAVRASELLPFTRVHGRPGKPHSHHWFLCPDLKASLQYKDPLNGTMLVELRGTGGQTVVPPSVHPSGDVLSWENRRPYLPMTAQDLQRLMAEIATVALLARHWPSGSRHIAALHVGGLFARFRLDAAHVERLMACAATVAGDDEVADRARAARESAERYLRGDHTTGGRSLAELLPQGATLLRTIYGWFGQQGSDQIDDMNQRHFVALLGSSMVVGNEREDSVLFQKFRDFRERYCNQFLDKKALPDVWLKSPQRREYEVVTFAPPYSSWIAGPKDYNLWRGFSTAPSTAPHPETRCARYLEHATRVIGAGNDRYGEYVLDLMADVVQKPGRLIGKTLCMRGPQGVGKSVFIEPFGWLFGRRHFIIVSARDQLVGQFNGHLSGRVVVFADEAVWGGHKQDEGTLKRLITQDTLTIRRLYVDAMMEPNCCHLFMATNEGWSFPAGNLERRLVILDVATKESEAYYQALWQEIRQPDFAASLLASLLARNVDESQLRRGLDTLALAEVKRLSASPVQQWWYQILEDGQFAPEQPWPEFLATRPLYDQYCEEMGQRRAGAITGTRASFVAQLHPLLPHAPRSQQQRVKVNVARYGATPEYVTRVERGYALAPLAICRAHFDQVTGSQHPWPADETLFPLL